MEVRRANLLFCLGIAGKTETKGGLKEVRAFMGSQLKKKVTATPKRPSDINSLHSRSGSLIGFGSVSEVLVTDDVAATMPRLLSSAKKDDLPNS